MAKPCTSGGEAWHLETLSRAHSCANKDVAQHGKELRALETDLSARQVLHWTMDNVTKATTSLTCNMVSKKNRHLPPNGDAHAPINDQVAGKHMSRTVRGSRTTNNVAHGANARMGAAAGCVCSGGPGQDQAKKCHKDQLSSGETRVDDGCVWTLIAGEPERPRPSAEAAELPLSRVAANSMKLTWALLTSGAAALGRRVQPQGNSTPARDPNSPVGCNGLLGLRPGRSGPPSKHPTIFFGPPLRQPCGHAKAAIQT